MTIQHLTFEDRGQDFLWWEVDDQSGRIVGCGPHQASVWASGRCSVDMSTVALGERPIFHGPATEPGGRTLNYVIAAIRPAETGGGVASMTDLPQLIDVVSSKLAEADGVDWHDREGWDRFAALGDRLVQELRDEHRARIRLDRQPATMLMGGVRTSATGGWAALLRNWVSAAQRRLEP